MTNTKTGFSTLIIEDSLHKFELLQNDTVAKDKLGMYIQMDIALAQFLKPKSCFHLVNTAMACKCAQSTFTAKNSIVNIEIFTLNDFDTSHLSGSDITNYFVVLESVYNPAGYIKKPITSSLLTRLNKTYGASRPVDGVGMMFYLDQKVTLNRNARFMIKTTFESGIQAEIESHSIFLKSA